MIFLSTYHSKLSDFALLILCFSYSYATVIYFRVCLQSKLAI